MTGQTDRGHPEPGLTNLAHGPLGVPWPASPDGLVVDQYDTRTKGLDVAAIDTNKVVDLDAPAGSVTNCAPCTVRAN